MSAANVPDLVAALEAVTGRPYTPTPPRVLTYTEQRRIDWLEDKAADRAADRRGDPAPLLARRARCPRTSGTSLTELIEAANA